MGGTGGQDRCVVQVWYRCVVLVGGTGVWYRWVEQVWEGDTEVENFFYE